jgi:LacI family transcriptional regulator
LGDAAISVAVPGVGDPFFASITTLSARPGRMSLILTSVGWEPPYEQRSIEAVLKRQVAGMIICPVGTTCRTYDCAEAHRWCSSIENPAPERRRGGAGRRRRRADATSHLISYGQHRAFMGDDTVTGLH